MLKTILKYGVIAGIIIAIPTYALSVALANNPPSPALGMVIGYTSMLVALSMVFMGVKHHRDTAGGGVISFWRALGIGLAISLIAGIFYAVTWEAALAATGMDFGSEYAGHLIAEAKARGDSAADIARLTAEMETFRTNYANPLYRMPMTFAEMAPVGLLVSLVSAALLRNSRFLPARAGSLPA